MMIINYYHFVTKFNNFYRENNKWNEQKFLLNFTLFIIISWHSSKRQLCLWNVYSINLMLVIYITSFSNGHLLNIRRKSTKDKGFCYALLYVMQCKPSRHIPEYFIRHKYIENTLSFLFI